MESQNKPRPSGSRSRVLPAEIGLLWAAALLWVVLLGLGRSKHLLGKQYRQRSGMQMHETLPQVPLLSGEGPKV